MKNGLRGAILVLIILSVTSVFAAEKRDFTFVNASGYPVRFVGVNPPGDEIWDENELNGILENGAMFQVEFDLHEKGCTWNIKVTWADDFTSSIFRDINVCKINYFKVHYDRRTDKASYTTD